MQIARLVSVVDSHVGGENARIVVGGIPHIPGETMVEKMEYFRDELKGLRRALVFEPRGWRAMWAAVLTAPTQRDADLGILFIGAPGDAAVVPMCGHLTIGATTVVIETGIVNAKEPVTTVNWDTAAGLVSAKAEVKDGRVVGVTLRNVPSFLYKKDVVVEVDGVGKVQMDIAYGGAFMAILEAKKIGLRVKPEQAQRIVTVGEKVLNAVNEQVKAKHPELSHIKTIIQTQIVDEPINPKADARNVIVCCHGPGIREIDRAPCPPGMCGEMAVLYEEGKLKLHEKFVTESIIGTMLTGKIIEETTVGNYRAIIAEVTSDAYITGINQITIHSDDPLKSGFLL